MPKSKRERKVTLSKTAKKGRDRKGAIMEEVRGCVDSYTNLFVFSSQNMRNTALKDVRAQLRTSRIFYGRNKLMAAALGRGASEEYRDGLSQVAQSLLGGDTGLIFTNETHESVRRCLKSAQVPEYARSGFEATRDVTLGESDLSSFPHSMEPFLRKLGLPTQLKAGVVTLLGDYTVCRKGQPLSPEAAKMLQLLDIKLAVFKLSLRCRWSDGEFEEFA